MKLGGVWAVLLGCLCLGGWYAGGGGGVLVAHKRQVFSDPFICFMAGIFVSVV